MNDVPLSTCSTTIKQNLFTHTESTSS
jgi:hypothetical protein